MSRRGHGEGSIFRGAMVDGQPLFTLEGRKRKTFILRTGLLPEAYIAPPELLDLRELLRHRAVLTRMRTAVKNRVHALLARQGIRQEHATCSARPAASSSPASSCPRAPAGVWTA